MPLKIGLAKDMKNTKTCMSLPKKKLFFHLTKYFKILFEILKKNYPIRGR
jgi:hypothetical protein